MNGIGVYGQLMVFNERTVFGVHVFYERIRVRRGFFPGTKGYRLFAKDYDLDQNEAEFKKTKDKGSKGVDITLTIDMLLHATRKHYDVAVLVAGDEDYVPLVRAVQGEGARVYVWFISNGLSPALRMVADCYVNLDEFLFE